MCSRKSESEGVITFRCNHEVTHMYDACMHDMHNACMHACLPASTYVRAYIQTNKRRNDGTNEQTHTQTFYNTCEGLHVECTTQVVLFRLKSSTQRHARRYTSTYMHL